MKKSYIIVMIMASVFLLSCQNCVKYMRQADWLYYIEVEDGTTCRVEYLNAFDVVKKGIVNGQVEYIDQAIVGKPYGSLVMLYEVHIKDEPTEFDITLQRTEGTGKCTVYFFNGGSTPEEFHSGLNDNFPAWIKENYTQRFVIEDNEPHYEKLKK